MDAMTRNALLITARTRAGLSQAQLAERIRTAGAKIGSPNECSRSTVARWETAGTVPQPFYIVLLETALGVPAQDLGMSRERLLEDSGLDTLPPTPDASMAYPYGPHSGIWLSSYTYRSTSRDSDFTSKHYVLLLQRGQHLDVRSLAGQHSRVSVQLELNGSVATGKWTEQTSADGYYGGALYSGAIQMMADPTGHRFDGLWVGFGRHGKVNTGPWQLTLVTADYSASAVAEWDKEP